MQTMSAPLALIQSEKPFFSTARMPFTFHEIIFSMSALYSRSEILGSAEKDAEGYRGSASITLFSRKFFLQQNLQRAAHHCIF